MDTKDFCTDFPFTKAAVPGGNLKLLGYASTWGLDRDNEYVLPSAFDGSLEKYLSSNPILLWQHDHKMPIGTVENAFLDEHGLNVKADVPKPDDREPDFVHLAYNKIKAGVVRTFSIGGQFVRGVKNGKRVITQSNWHETSVVSVPANPGSIFSAAVKALEGSARPLLTPEALDQMAQLIGMQPVSDPELASMGADERKARYEMLAGMYKHAGVNPPSYDGWRQWVTESKGIDPRERLPHVLRFMAQQQGREPFSKHVEETVEELAALHREIREGDDVKAGRVLSKANEDKLRRMMALGQELLSAVEADNTPEEEEEPPATEMSREG